MLRHTFRVPSTAKDRARLFGTVSAHELGTILDENGFLASLPDGARLTTAKWLTILARREMLSSMFMPWEGDSQKREEIKNALMRLTFEPSLGALERFLDLAEKQGYPCLDGRIKLDLLDYFRKNDAKLDPTFFIMHGLLRDLGILFYRRNEHTMTVDILATARFLGDTQAHIIDRKTALFYDTNMSLIRDVNLSHEGWANKYGFIVLREEMTDVPNGHLTDLEECIAQHEAQHVLDQKASIAFGNMEYTAYLASIAFGSPTTMLSCLSYPEDQAEPHRSALVRIRAEIHARLGVPAFTDSFGIVQADRIRRIARDLLNEVYAEKTGFTYDQMVEPFRFPSASC